jgi:hypothetical protein
MMEFLDGLTDWGLAAAGAVPRPIWMITGGAVLVVATRETIFETHAVISYRARRAMAEARADREWNRLGSLSESEFDALISARNEWAEEKFRKGDICKIAAEEAAFGIGFPGRVAALRKRAQKHMSAMHAINAETQRLLELKARIDSERTRQSVGIDHVQLRRLMADLISDSQAVAVGALMELNRLASRSRIDWEPFVPREMPPAVRERTFKILRKLAGTNSLSEARNAYAQYQQALRAHRSTPDGEAR